MYANKTRQNKPHIIPLYDDIPLKPRRSQHRIFSTLHRTNIVQASIYQFLGNVITSRNKSIQPRSCKQKDIITDMITDSLNLEHVCNGVVHPIIGNTITKYTKLINDPITKETLQKDFA